MLIGENFDKISFEMFGLQLLEPNTFISDILIVLVSIFAAYKVSRFQTKSIYFKYWTIFFVFFAISTFFGALGHLLFNYWGLAGKYPAWFLVPFSVFFIEQATFVLLESDKLRKTLKIISWTKLIVALVGVILTILFVDLTDYSKGMRIPTLNTTIGLAFCLGILGYSYMKRINSCFKYFVISTFVLIPAALFQSLKINIHPWFDKNDGTHVILSIGVIFFYITLKKYNKFLIDG